MMVVLVILELNLCSPGVPVLLGVLASTSINLTFNQPHPPSKSSSTNLILHQPHPPPTSSSTNLILYQLNPPPTSSPTNLILHQPHPPPTSSSTNLILHQPHPLPTSSSAHLIPSQNPPSINVTFTQYNLLCNLYHLSIIHLSIIFYLHSIFFCTCSTIDSSVGTQGYQSPRIIFEWSHILMFL